MGRQSRYCGRLRLPIPRLGMLLGQPPIEKLAGMAVAHTIRPHLRSVLMMQQTILAVLRRAIRSCTVDF